MKGRLIKDAQGEVLFLSSSGQIVPASLGLIRTLLFNFDTVDQNAWASDVYWKTEYVQDMTLYPGETMAFVTDAGHLVITNSEPFHLLEEKNKNLIDPTRYLTVPAYAKKHKKSREIIGVFCRQGRISGAFRDTDGKWKIPEDAPYPVRVDKQRFDTGRPKKAK